MGKNALQGMEGSHGPGCLSYKQRENPAEPDVAVLDSYLTCLKHEGVSGEDKTISCSMLGEESSLGGCGSGGWGWELLSKCLVGNQQNM